MSQKTVINASINNRQITLKREFYWGLAFGICFQKDPRDLEFIFILPFLCWQLEIEKSPSKRIKI